MGCEAIYALDGYKLKRPSRLKVFLLEPERCPVLRADTSLPKPLSSRDFEFFYEGLRDGKLLVQKCSSCGQVRNPPGPMCPNCRSLEWAALECTGLGTVHSYTIHHHPPLPGFAIPHVMVLADMEEGFRLLGGYAGSGGIEIGMPLATDFMQCGDTATFQFRAP